MNRIVLLLVAVSASVGALAQTRSSFLGVDVISDIIVQASNAGLTYNVQVANDPSFVYQSQTYHIVSLIGFYALSDDDDLTVTNSNFLGNFGPWITNNSNANGGGIAGWRANPNNGIPHNANEVFNFTALSVASVERVGFHVVTVETFPGTQGNTGDITLVPEPSVLLALGLGLAAAVRRRRSRQSRTSRVLDPADTRQTRQARGRTWITTTSL